MTSVRNLYIDTLRAAALVRVVVFHTVPLAWLTVIFPAMGAMFALAGSLMAQTLDRSGTKAGIRGRLLRLLPVLWVYGASAVSVMLLHGWSASDERPFDPKELLFWVFPAVDPPANEWGHEYFAAELWYLRTYLWLVLLSPLLLPLFRHWPVPTLLAPFIVVLAADRGYFDNQSPVGTACYEVATWAPCWLLGFAHRDGLLRRLSPTAVAAISVSAAGLAALWFFTQTEPERSFDLNNVPITNVLWSIALLVVLLRWEPRLDWLARRRPLYRLVGVINARAVTIYLWHMPAVLIAGLVLEPLDLDSPLLSVCAVGIITGLFVLALGWVEDLAARRPPRLLPDLGRTSCLHGAAGGAEPSAAPVPAGM
jgi:peptidoglycan/LPS O-acetylase OafA/YrhL